MQGIKISIIIPVYNGEEYIERCVNSIISQKYSNYEIILVENNSTDSSYEKCITLAKCNRNVLTISTKAKGVSEARNIGLEHATGTIISFCDADDYLQPGSLKAIEEIFIKTKTDVLVTGINKRREEVIYEVASYSIEKEVSAEKLIAMVVNDRKIMGSVCNKFYKKEILKDVTFDSTLTHCEDTFFNILVLQNNIKCKCIISNVITYNYCCNNLSATNDLSKKYDSNNQLRYNVTFIKAKNSISLSKRNQAELGYAIFTFSIAEYCRLVENDCSNKKDKMKILVSNIREYFSDYVKCLPRYITIGQVKKIIKYNLYRIGGEK